MLNWIEAFRQCRVLYRVNDSKNVLQVGRKGSHQHLAHLVICIEGSEKREERQERWTVLGFCFNPIFIL